jgi:hypothetical protein
VPALARAYESADSNPATREATAVVFDSLNRYLGVAIGECLGYLFTGAWTVLVSIAMLQSSTFDAWLASPGIVVGGLLILGSFEFVGSTSRGIRLGRCGRTARRRRSPAVPGSVSG